MPLRFPLAGLDVSCSFDRQPNRPMPDGSYARTTPVAMNVRVYEPTTGRARGGQRPGLAKYIATQVNGSNPIQCLDEIVMTHGIVPGSDIAATPPNPPTPVQIKTGTMDKPLDVLVAVSGGSVAVAYNGAWYTVHSGANALLGTAPVIRSFVNNQKMYFLDGVNYGNAVTPQWQRYNPQINSMETFAATAGTLPMDSAGNGPRLGVNWRGRAFVAGWPNDPRNWSLSAVNNVQDWNYFPVPIVPTQAIRGDASPLGLIGDVVTTLIPYSDDVAIIGGDHTIWLMKGDPFDGGKLHNLSETIGMAWGIPWVRDPYGTIYFISNQMGIYSMVPDGSQPTRVSQPIEPLLAAQNIGSTVFRLLWDDANQGFSVFATTYTGPTSSDSHFFWEQRVGAWTQQQFGNANHNPMTCVVYAGNAPSDRVSLFGSFDGYVRSFSNSAVTDDGTAISSAVVIGPILTEDLDDIMLKDLQGILGASSGNVNYAVYVGATAEIALASTPVVSGVWTAGRDFTSYVRWAGHAIYIKLSATNSWSMESLRARVEGLGRVRQRGF